MKTNPKEIKKIMPAAAIGIEFSLSVVAGAFIGYWLDVWLETKPFLMLLWMFFGFVAGMRSFIKMAKKLKSDENEPK